MRPKLSVADDRLLDRIIDEARSILATTGMEIRGPQLRQRLLDAGLPVAADGRILFPADVIDRALASAPRAFKLYNRDGDLQADIGDDRVHFTPGSSGLKVQDHRTGATRHARTADFAEYVRLVDGLDNIPYLATAFSTEDIEPNISDAWRLYLCLTNSKKPVVSGAFTEHGVTRMAEMMQLFRRDRADLIARPLDLYDHGHRQFPLFRRFLPEPARLCRVGHPG
ncbi:MAG: trimethylamine methyltransferase family protein [Anaerolineales bacterium]|nr:trimethylamine methyltransferase family protein [Anaerolineales bacterium]